jgi:hypothetical protein
MAEAKSTRNCGEEWTDDDIKQLRELAEGNTPTGVIRLGRSEVAVRSKAKTEGISLAPANRPPYGETLLPLPEGPCGAYA